MTEDDTILLTQAGKKNQKSSVFWNKTIDVSAGFISEFTMSVNQKTCLNDNNRVKNGAGLQAFKKQECGGEGFAFVI
jgi:hypothetical protein